jgi:hypothetical protein
VGEPLGDERDRRRFNVNHPPATSSAYRNCKCPFLLDISDREGYLSFVARLTNIDGAEAEASSR